MPQKENYNDLYAFYLVACEKNFSRASAKLGISPQALSKTIKLLENRLGLQLFHRTTRTVSLTQAGEGLFATAQKSFSYLNNELERLAHYRENPSGTVKITAGLQVVQDILIPRLAHFKSVYPDITLQFHADNRFVDIVSEGFDAGVRLGDDVGETMIAVKISEPLKMCVVGTPALFEQHGFVKHINELINFPSIAYVMSNGKYYDWEFCQNGESVKITPNAQFVFDDDQAIKTACLHDAGLAYLPQNLVQNELDRDELVSVLQSFCLALPALYLYYPHRNISPALRAVVDCLKL